MAQSPLIITPNSGYKGGGEENFLPTDGQKMIKKVYVKLGEARKQPHA